MSAVIRKHGINVIRSAVWSMILRLAHVYKHVSSQSIPFSLCNKRHELAENLLSLILINLVPKVAFNCE